VFEPEAFLVLSHLNIQNANAISSPLLWGFPSPTAFLGFTHALHRLVRPHLGLSLDGVGIVCHKFEAQASQPAGKRTQVFHLSRNPFGSDGKPPALVEEGRVHLDVSLVIGVRGESLFGGKSSEEMALAIGELAASMRVAGGSLVPRADTKSILDAELHLVPGSEEAETQMMRRVRRRLLPGFALVSRERLLEERHQELIAGNADSTMLDAFLDLASLNIDPPQQGSSGANPEWHVRRRPGWIVPIATGFHALSEVHAPGTVKNSRDRMTPFRFVEGVYTMGEWKSPHRIKDLRQILWTYAAEPDEGLYRCTTPYFSELSSHAEGQ
jgi:CRISPR-associated protein Csy2